MFHAIDVTAFQSCSSYEELWTIPDDQLQQSSAVECSSSTDQMAVLPPSYINHTAPPPPYTERPRLGEVSIHQSPPLLQEHNQLIDQDDNDSQPNMMSCLADTQASCQQHQSVSEHHQSASDNIVGRPHNDNDVSYTEQYIAMESTDEQATQLSYHEDDQQSNNVLHPLATSTPTHDQCSELQVSTNIFVKSLTTSPQNNNLPPINKSIPLLRPIRTSAPDLFATYPPPVTMATRDIDSLNNTIPRMGRLPPLRRKPNSSHYNRSLSDGGWPVPFYDYNRTLSHSISVGECEPISEVSCEPSSNETIATNS